MGVTLFLTLGAKEEESRDIQDNKLFRSFDSFSHDRHKHSRSDGGIVIFLTSASFD